MGRDKQVIFSIGVGLILLSTVIGCAAEQPIITITGSTTGPSHTPTDIVTPFSARRSSTPTPFIGNQSSTSTPTLTLTPSYSNDLLGICPKENYVPLEEYLAVIGPTRTPRSDDIAGPVFDNKKINVLLNSYGAGPFIKYISEHGRDHYGLPRTQVYELTGDGVNEVIVRWANTYIYTCYDGEYKLIFETMGGGLGSWPPMIQEVKDGNLNGVPEMLFDYGGSYEIFEFTGEQFQELTDPDSHLKAYYDSSARFRDTNGDGEFEVFVYKGEAFGDTLRFLLPQRKEWDTYKWDGTYYRLIRRDFSPPEYRYQAAYDGDRSTLYGEYDKALTFYQDVIYRDALDWWSEEKLNYLQALAIGNHPRLSHEPDLNEYPYLSAYARYRIMLLYLLQGWDSDAQVVYETLQAKYPTGTPGSIYAHLAQLFREEYQVSQDIGQACQAVITDADMNASEVLKYLGIDGSMGMMIYYHIRDICPFK